jgi:hypothetical protein
LLTKRKAIDLDRIEEFLTRIGIVKEDVEEKEWEEKHTDHYSIGPLEAYFIQLQKNNEDIMN